MSDFIYIGMVKYKAHVDLFGFMYMCLNLNVAWEVFPLNLVVFWYGVLEPLDKNGQIRVN